MKKIAYLLLLLPLLLGFTMCGKTKKKVVQPDSEVVSSNTLEIQVGDTTFVYSEKNLFSDKKIREGVMGKSFSFRLPPIENGKYSDYKHVEMQLLYTHTGTGDYTIVDGDEFNENMVANNQLAVLIIVGDEKRGAYILADTPQTKAMVKDMDGLYSISIHEPLAFILQDEPTASFPETIKLKLKDFSLE